MGDSPRRDEAAAGGAPPSGDRRSQVDRRLRPPGSLRHDLRTPLNQILGYAEMLQEEAAEAAQDRFVPDLQKIGAAARQLLGLIDYVPDGAPSPPGPEPAGAETVMAPRRAEVAAPRERPALVAAGARLLVVDDNEMNRDMLSRRLKKRGYTVVTAEDGRQALELVDTQSFDLILLDIMMPGLSGIDVLKTLRERHSMGELPIIMATARDQGEDIVEALKLGANDYVTKPLDFPVVLARAETQLSLKSAMEEIRRLAQGLEIRNRFIRQAFGRYLSDEVVESLLETPEGLKLGGEKRTVTLLMADLRGFTALTERLTPEQVVRLLNNYLGTMADIITHYNGTIDEFVGDAIMALFGAPIDRPDDAERAAACAVAMQLAMKTVNEGNRNEGLPEVQMGVALNTGEVVVGNIGSLKRAKYGVVGSHVNLTGRIESYTVGGQILVSQYTVEKAGPVLEVGERRSFQTKGFQDPITVFDLYGVGGRHDLFLPEGREALVTLRDALPVSFTVVEGKKVQGAAFQGGLVRVSHNAAELRSDEPIEHLSNIRIRLGPEGVAGGGGDLYAKVVGTGEGGSTFLVRFTSSSPETSKIIDGALSGAAGTG